MLGLREPLLEGTLLDFMVLGQICGGSFEFKALIGGCATLYEDHFMPGALIWRVHQLGGGNMKFVHLE